jgi:hypothetical protein
LGIYEWEKNNIQMPIVGTVSHNSYGIFTKHHQQYYEMANGDEIADN